MKYFIVLAFLLLNSTAYSQLKWKKLGELQEGRHFYGAAYLGNGNVLVAGGFVISQKDTSKYTLTSTCELLDVRTGTSDYSTPMSVKRAEFPFLYDKDSNLIAVSGVTNDAFTEGGLNVNTPVVESYNRLTNSWRVLGNLIVPRRQHAALFLNDSEILVVAGRQSNLASIASSEIFNIKTGKSRAVADYPIALNNIQFGVLPNGEPLFFGGRTGGAGSSRVADVFNFNRTFEKWIRVDSIYTGVNGVGVLQLHNGNFLISGGATSESATSTSPVKNVWMRKSIGYTPMPNLLFGRSAHSVAQLDDDRVITVGGWNAVWHAYANSEILNMSTKTIDTISNLDGHVLFKLLTFPTPVGSTTTSLPNTLVCISGQTGIKFDASANAIGITLTKVVEILTDVGVQPSACNFLNSHKYDFSSGFDAVTAPPQFKAVGSATFTDRFAKLVSAESFQTGAIWLRQVIPVGCGFSANFSFKSVNGTDNGKEDGSIPGADGIAFVVQNTSTASKGESGGGIGYAGIPNALAVEFDTYKNDVKEDINGNHIAVQCSGTNPVSSVHRTPDMLAINRSIPTMVDEKRYYARIEYNLKPKKFRVYFGTAPDLLAPVIDLDSIDLKKLLSLENSENAYVGFTSSTGNAVAQYEILDFSVCSCPLSTISAVEPDQSDDHLGNASAAAIAVSPSPGREYVHISIPSLSHSNSLVRIYDVMGRLVATLGSGIWSVSSTSFEWDCSTASSGSYTVTVDCLGSRSSTQVFVSH